MYTTYHLSSANEMDVGIVEAIKAIYKSKPITITVEESDEDFELSQEMKSILDNRLQEESAVYLTADESLDLLRKKYGV
ncbi:hypothetical protein [Petrimonas sp.]|uniref:hypothetical protein n=1 Tax=Petrimonas sp. TaxID=2023866 RepID=UPI003F51747D